MDLTDKTVVIIEGNRRIGAAVSLALAERGARVTCLYTIEDKTFADAVSSYNKQVKLFSIKPHDVSSLQKALSQAKKHLPSIDILINYVNTEQGGYYTPTSPEKKWESAFSLDAQGLYGAIEPVLSLMTKQGYGSIMTIADSPLHGALSYLAMRNEITHFTKTLGRELAKKHIRLNAIIPGPIEGEDYSQIMQTYSTELSMYFPSERLATIHEIVEPALFFASDAASYVFAETIRVDCGFAS
ncbi:SDR family NAD(P)-dependent oxidoreductase [Candidatus Omnitrophota bacterium]